MRIRSNDDRPRETHAARQPAPSTPGRGADRSDPAYWRNDQYQRGARPPDKALWESWSPEQRAAAGLPRFEDWQRAARSWRQEVRTMQADADRRIGEEAKRQGLDLNLERDLIRAMNAAGIFDRHEEGRAGYRRRIEALRQRQGVRRGTLAE